MDVGEEIVASAGTRTGPNHWILAGVFAIVFIVVYALLYALLQTTNGPGGAVGAAAAGAVAWTIAGLLLSERPYLMAITDRRVVLVEAIVFIVAYALLYTSLQTTIGPGGAVSIAAAGAVAWTVAGLLSERPYLMAITDRRVFLVKASSMLGRPRGIRFVDPRSAVKITSAKSSVLGIQFAYCRASARPMTMYFSRPWREDMQAIVRTMTGESQLAAGDEAARR